MGRTLMSMAVAALVLATSGLGGGAAAQAQEDATGEPSLYERLGGVYGVAVLVDHLVDRLAADSVLLADPYVVEAFQRVPMPGIKFQVTAMLCAATGGPETYHGRSMRDAHAHLRITPAQWQAFLGDLREVIAGAEVGEAEAAELLAIVEASRADIVTAPDPVPEPSPTP